MHVHDAPDVVTLVHGNSDPQRLAIKAADQMPPGGMRGEIHSQIRIDHQHILNGDVVAAPGPNRPGIKRGRVIEHLIGIKNGDPFERRVGALQRYEGNA